MTRPRSSSANTAIALLVASLGYCVDVFDIVLFSIYRVQSLQSLGLNREEILTSGMYIMNMQLAGMVLGGILWGVLGDKIGRLQVLFGSILVYSTASIVNAYVSDVDTYAWCRFIAGLGLAGEAGAAVTLVSELMPKHKRGIGTAIVAAAGTFGAVLAAVAAEFIEWRNAYLLGGVLGFLLLMTRISVSESSMFASLKRESSISRGNVALLFSSRDRFFRYMSALLAGLPLFFSFYTVIHYTPELARSLGINGDVTVAKASLISSIAMTVGDLVSGFLSRAFKSRKKVLFIFVGMAAVSTELLMVMHGASATAYYLVCGCVGFGLGYWAVFLTTAAEQFGTNIRVTVASTIPNIIRLAPILMGATVLAARDTIGYLPSLQIVGTLSFAISLCAIWRLRETYGVELNFVEVSDGTRSFAAEDAELQRAEGWV